MKPDLLFNIHVWEKISMSLFSSLFKSGEVFIQYSTRTNCLNTPTFHVPSRTGTHYPPTSKGPWTSTPSNSKQPTCSATKTQAIRTKQAQCAHPSSSSLGSLRNVEEYTWRRRRRRRRKFNCFFSSNNNTNFRHISAKSLSPVFLNHLDLTVWFRKLPYHRKWIKFSFDIIIMNKCKPLKYKHLFSDHLWGFVKFLRTIVLQALVARHTCTCT